MKDKNLEKKEGCNMQEKTAQLSVETRNSHRQSIRGERRKKVKAGIENKMTVILVSLCHLCR